jgi:hypothetical protein
VQDEEERKDSGVKDYSTKSLELNEKSPSIKMLIAPTGAELLLLKDN